VNTVIPGLTEMEVSAMSDLPAELAARATAAHAAASDFRKATDAWLTSKGEEPNWSDWAFRLGSELESVLDGLDDAATGAGVAQRGGGWISGSSRS
jgi:hypothetical protein